MTLKQFKGVYELIREAGARGMVAAGEMRVSEAAMTMANVDKEAERFWRKNRAHLKGMKPGEMFAK